jgi:uncharacterized protein
MLSDQVLNQLKQYLYNQPEIELAYIYGSQQSGEAKSESDIDIAVKLAPNTDSTLIRSIIADLNKLTGKEIDCKSITLESHPVFANNVIMGKPLLVRNERDRVHFEVRIMQRYRDDERRRRIYRHYYPQMFT